MVARGVRSSWEASATNWRTCCSLRWRWSREASTWSSIALSAAPTCPISVRSSVSRGGTRSAISISPGGQRQLGDAVGGGRDLAQRRQLTAYDDRAPTPARRQHRPAEGRQQLQPDQVLERLVTSAGGGRRRAARRQVVDEHPVVAETGETHGSAARGSRARSARASSCASLERGRRGPAGPVPLGEHLSGGSARVGQHRPDRAELLPRPEVTGSRRPAVPRRDPSRSASRRPRRRRAGRSRFSRMARVVAVPITAAVTATSSTTTATSRAVRVSGRRAPAARSRLTWPASGRSRRRAWCGSSGRARRRPSCGGRRCRARRRWPARRSRTARRGRGSAPCSGRGAGCA